MVGLIMRLFSRKRRRDPALKAARHVIPSYILSADDDPGRPDGFLMDVGLEAVALARSCDLSDIATRNPAIGRFIDTWPGEHYRLLAGLVRALSPKTVVEIGTATGASALCLLKYMAPGSQLFTFDIEPWQRVEGSLLRADDFANGRLVQFVEDLTSPPGFNRHAERLAEADIIFIDAAKDGVMERRLLDMMLALPCSKAVVLLFDDTRVPNMIGTWRSINRPKLDLTSFGHWSGTGITYLGSSEASSSQ
jgi:predicted O-methyltransferase YrrM